MTLAEQLESQKNSWEEHRWTSWSCKDMKEMLDEVGLPWKDGGSVNYISV